MGRRVSNPWTVSIGVPAAFLVGVDGKERWEDMGVIRMII